MLIDWGLTPFLTMIQSNNDIYNNMLIDWALTPFSIIIQSNNGICNNMFNAVFNNVSRRFQQCFIQITTVSLPTHVFPGFLQQVLHIT